MYLNDCNVPKCRSVNLCVLAVSHTSNEDIEIDTTTNAFEYFHPCAVTMASSFRPNGVSNSTLSSSMSSSSHAVSRSNELLACAKTSYKVRQQKEMDRVRRQDPTAVVPQKPIPAFRLASPSDPSPKSLVILEDGLTLLRSMEYGLKQLKILVRRRGATNDPTHEIATLVKQLEQDTQELTEFCESILKIRRRKQAKKHWELIVEWFQQVAMTYSAQLQDCLKLRGEILTEQAQQRRRLVDSKSSSQNPGEGSGPSSSRRNFHQGAISGGPATASPLFDSPLFAPTVPSKRQTPNGSHSRYDSGNKHRNDQLNDHSSVPSQPPSSSKQPPYTHGSNARNGGYGGSSSYYGGAGQGGYGGGGGGGGGY